MDNPDHRPALSSARDCPAELADAPPIEFPTPIESRWLVAVVFLGIALRIVVLMFRPADLHTDPDGYVAHAETLLQTGSFCVPGTTQPTAFRPPLYPMLLAAMMWCGLKSSVAVGLVNLLSGAALMISTWWLARMIGLRGVQPAIAAGVTAIDPLSLRYTVLPMTETISAALLTVAMLQFLKMLDAARSSSLGFSRKALNAGLTSGLCFGLNGLCRPIVFLTCAVLTAWCLIHLCRRLLSARASSSFQFRRQLLLILAPALMAGCVAAPWVIRNYIRFDKLIPATTHGGYTLLLGNNRVFFDEVVLVAGQPVWGKDSLLQWQQQMNSQMSAQLPTPILETDADRWMYQRAVQEIQADPAAFGWACVLRWKRFWAVAPAAEMTAISPFERTLLTGWYVMMWLGLAGSVVFCTFRGRGDIQLLWLAILSFLLLHTFYWTNARMRAPLTGVIVVLAVFGFRLIYCRLYRPKNSVSVAAGS